MICPNCGTTLSDDAQFCGTCGAKIAAPAAAQPVQPVQYVAPVQQAAPAANQNAVSAADIANKAKAVGGEALNKANAVADSATAAVQKVVPGVNKKILIIAAAALVVVIVACFIIFGNLISNAGSSSFTRIPHHAYPVNNDGELVLFIDGKAVSTDAEFKSGSYTYAYNANAFVYGDVLYKVDGNKLVEVNESVSSVKVSKNSNAFVYISDDALYIYKDGKEKLIFDEFEGNITSGAIVISPNGNSVAFMDKTDDGIATYLYSGSSAQQIGKNYYPLSISDDASVFYGLKYDVNDSGSAAKTDNLYIIKNKKAEDAVKVKSDITGIKYSSKDAKKILFLTSSGTYYFAPNLSESIKVDSGSVSVIVPRGNVAAYDDFKSFIGTEGSSVKKFTLKGDSFEKYTIASNVDSFSLSADGKKLVYMKNYSLYSISTTSDNAEAIKLESMVTSFETNADLTKIYIKNVDGELVFSNGSSEKTTKITDDVEQFAVSLDGVCCYEKDDALYSTSGGSKGAKVDKMSDVSSVYVKNASIFYVYNDGTLYVSTNGKNFTKSSVEN